MLANCEDQDGGSVEFDICGGVGEEEAMRYFEGEEEVSLGDTKVWRLPEDGCIVVGEDSDVDWILEVGEEGGEVLVVLVAEGHYGGHYGGGGVLGWRGDATRKVGLG